MVFFRTDLAIEDGLNTTKEISIFPDCKIEELFLNRGRHKKRRGFYYTLSFDAVVLNKHDELDAVSQSLSYVLKKLLAFYKLDLKSSLLIVGLGNDSITPDSLGPKVIDNIFVTKHLAKRADFDASLGLISAISPGVMGQTGMETANIVKALVNFMRPDAVIVIDALASKSLARLNQTIQITDAGINPGSGVGNKRKELSFKTLGVPVFAIGVPTVVDIASILDDSLQSIPNKNEILAKAIHNLEREKSYYMVSSKTIDEEIRMLSEVISKGLNLAIHHLENYD